MVIIETSVFTRQVSRLLSDDAIRQLQAELAAYPDAGAIIPGSKGLRKIRCSLQGQGKRGGSRAIYYWAVAHDQLLMQLIYPKNMQDDLTPAQIKMLRHIVEVEYP